jgi:hypothetical protein
VTRREAGAAAALWRRIDTPGHDAALLTRSAVGWRLLGTAVFLHADGPARLSYELVLDADWRTVRGSVRGFLAGRQIERKIVRGERGWTLDDVRVAGLDHLVDLDLGFTPATNLQQLRRARLAAGEGVDLPVAWLDAGADALEELPQRYERLDATRVRYSAPSVPYAATLELADSGFVRLYPGLWEMDAG